MKLYKLSFMALAMAGALVACSDKDTYEPAPQSPGAYFESSSPKVIKLADNATSVDIPVRRTSTSVAATTNLTVSGDTELFSFPSSVTFDGDALQANIAVGYDPATLEYDKKYNVEISVSDDSQYGLGTYQVALMLPSPVVENVIYAYDPSKIGSGKGASYTFGLIFSDTDTDLGVIQSYFSTNPSIVTYTIAPWGAWDEDAWDPKDEDAWRNDNQLKLIVDTAQELPADDRMGRPAGCYPVSVPLTKVGVKDGDDYDIYIEGMEEYFVRNEDPESAEAIHGATFFNPATGLFTLYVIYVCPDYSVGAYYKNGFEYCQLPGYPDYSLKCSYKGYFTDAPELQSYIFGDVTTGPDFDVVKVVNIIGNDTETAIKAILDGTMECQTMEPSETKEFRFAIGGPGLYTLLAVGFKGGEMVKTAVDEYNIGAGCIVDNDRWVSVGECLFVDGWIIPGYQSGGVGLNPQEYAYTVDVQQDTIAPGHYRIDNPYGIDITPLGDLNEYDGHKVYIYFDATDPDFVFMLPQFCGYDFGEEDGESGRTTICDRNGWYLSDPDITKEDVLAYYAKKGWTMEEDWSYDDDGVIIFQPTMFSAWGQEGLSWKVQYPAEIWFPGTYTPQEVAARHIKRIANQGFQLNLQFGESHVSNRKQQKAMMIHAKASL